MEAGESSPDQISQATRTQCRPKTMTSFVLDMGNDIAGFADDMAMRIKSRSNSQELGCSSTTTRVLSDNSMSSSLAAMFHFEDSALLRGTCCADVLHSGGRVLRNSEGSALTYKMSAAVDYIDSFISHNWSTPRSSKFNVLVLCFNFKAAAMAVVLLMVVEVVLSALDVLPCVEMLSEHGRLYRSHLFCCVGGVPLFVLVLFSWHEIARFIPGTQPNVFLDKTCIHQTDARLKELGVMSLAAYLKHSRRMVVIYNEKYLKKLWTVYELASFLTIHESNRLWVVPLHLPPVVWRGALFFWLITLVYVLSHVAVVRRALLEWRLLWLSVWGPTFFALPCTYMLCVAFRLWLLDQEMIQSQVDSFRIREAECFDERDRPIVHANVAHFVRGLKLVSRDASLDQALDAFDRKVRRDVPRAIQRSVGKVGIPYVYILAIFMSHCHIGTDFLIARVKEPINLQVANAFFFYFFTAVGAYPAGTCFMIFLLRKTLWILSTWKVKVTLLVASMAGLTGTTLMVTWLDRLHMMANESWLAFAGLLLFGTSLVLSVAYHLGELSSCRRRRKREVGVDSTHSLAVRSLPGTIPTGGEPDMVTEEQQDAGGGEDAALEAGLKAESDLTGGSLPAIQETSTLRAVATEFSAAQDTRRFASI